MNDVEIDGLTKRFGQRLAVDQVTFTVPRGKVLGLIGQNGAGKSTLIRMLVGLLAPTSGSIRIAGLDRRRDRDALKRKVGYVPDRPTIYSRMRVQEAIDFAWAVYGEQFNLDRCMQLLKRLRIDRTQRIGKLSKGQAAKLQLLLAVCHDPQVLILDEPTDGMDLIARKEFFEGVIHLAAEREQTVLLSSHALSDVRQLADEIAFMDDGKLLMRAPVDELLGRMKRLRIVLRDGQPPVTPAGFVWQELRGREWLLTLDHFQPEQIQHLRAENQIESLETFDMTLEDVFRDVIRGNRKEAV